MLRFLRPFVFWIAVADSFRKIFEIKEFENFSTCHLPLPSTVLLLRFSKYF